MATGGGEMALERIIRAHGVEWTDIEEKRIQHHMDRLARHLRNHPAPKAMLSFTGYPAKKRIGLHLRVELGPLGGHLLSRQSAETADQATRLAVEDIERQLERRHAAQTGEATYGVPSRRLPSSLRPTPYSTSPTEGASEEEAKPEVA
jgi:ribosome-associated translation inhibitor RaiA